MADVAAAGGRRGRLRRELLGLGGDLAASVPERTPVESFGSGTASGEVPAPSGSDLAPALAAMGPRARAHAEEYELLLELIAEGSALHYGRGRVLVPADDDLALLLGDQLYALGLARLAELGDLHAVAELADVISLVAQAQAAGNPDLAAAVWQAGAAAIGWGPSPAHAAAKAAARAEAPGAAAALRAAGDALTGPARDA